MFRQTRPQRPWTPGRASSTISGAWVTRNDCAATLKQAIKDFGGGTGQRSRRAAIACQPAGDPGARRHCKLLSSLAKEGLPGGAGPKSNVVSCTTPAGAWPPDTVRRAVRMRRLRLLAASLTSWLRVWRNEAFEPIRAAWLERGHRPGERLRITSGRQIVERDFAGLGPGRELVVSTLDGIRHLRGVPS